MSQPSLEHKWLDGPLFVAWLFEVCPDLEGNTDSMLGSAIVRRMFDWKKGSRPYAYEIPDRACVRLGLHLDDIPDHIWLKEKTGRRPARGSRAASWERRRAVAMVREGYFPSEVAAELNVATRTVSNWVKAA